MHITCAQRFFHILHESWKINYVDRSYEKNKYIPCVNIICELFFVHIIYEQKLAHNLDLRQREKGEKIVKGKYKLKIMNINW